MLYNKTYQSFSGTGTLEIELNSKLPEEIKEEIKPFNIQSLLNALSDFKLARGENSYTDNDNIYNISGEIYDLDYSEFMKISKSLNSGTKKFILGYSKYVP